MALGVSFGLACSLGLKHSHLSSYPHIESCIVALVAYTSYFFSNGISMSGESLVNTPPGRDSHLGSPPQLALG
jgi:NhaP-type Na+/H+ or K+/H+ antiporter